MSDCQIIPLFPDEPIPDVPNGPLYQAWKRIRDDELAIASNRIRWSVKSVPCGVMVLQTEPLPTMEQVKDDLIERALKRYGSVEAAADAIGISRATIYNRKPKPQSSP